MKSAVGWKGTKEKIPVSIKNEQGNVVEGNEVMQVWELAFKKIANETLYKDYNSDFLKQVKEEVEKISNNEEERNIESYSDNLNKEIKLEEVVCVIKKLKRGKAA